MLGPIKPTLDTARRAARELVRHPRSPRSRLATIVVSVAIVVVLGVASTLVLSHARSLPDDAVLAVGDQLVTIDDFDAEVTKMRALYGVEQPVDRPEKMDDFRRRAAKAIAVSIVLDRQSVQIGVRVPDKKARDVLDAYVADQMGSGPDGRGQFVRALGNVGTSERAVLEAIRRQLAVDAMFRKVTAGVTVAADELAREFPRYRDSLGTPERRRISNIVVKSRERAQMLLRRLHAGTDFAGLARSESLDEATRAKGGDLGIVTAQQLQNTYARAAFSTPSGRVFGPVDNQFGWNVGRVVDVVPARPAAYKEVEGQLRTLVEFDRRIERWRSWLESAIKAADVRYADDYRPTHPDSAPTAGPAAPVNPPPDSDPSSGRGER